MNDQETLTRLLKERQDEMEREWRIHNGLETDITERDQEQFQRFVRQFDRGCCGE